MFTLQIQKFNVTAQCEGNSKFHQVLYNLLVELPGEVRCLCKGADANGNLTSAHELL